MKALRHWPEAEGSGCLEKELSCLALFGNTWQRFCHLFKSLLNQCEYIFRNRTRIPLPALSLAALLPS